MKIAIDAHAAEKEGEGNCTYIRHLLLALAGLDQENQYIFYAINSSHPFYRNFANHPNIKIKSLWFSSPLIRIPLILAFRTLLDRPDILHVQYIAPPFFSGRLVTTIHDLGFLHHPEAFHPLMAFRSRLLMRRTAAKSAAIITGSYFSRDDIASLYDLNKEVIEVIPYGVSERFSPHLPWKETEAVLARYGLKTPYFLTVSRLNPRKNLDSLLGAFALLKKQRGLPHFLVIVGKKDYRSDELFHLVGELGLEKEVIFPGLVEERDLPYIYRAADLFVFPSLFEGFGLPVLEAMKSGLPVITSDSSSLAEIASGAALVINPVKSEQLGQAILKVVVDSDLRRKLIQQSLKRAEQFTWQATARQTLEVYQQVIGQR